MADASRSASQEQVPASPLQIRVRYGRLSVALIGALALVATVVGAVLAPFTALSFGLVGIFFATAVLSVATLRALAVQDRNRKLLAHLEATRQRALQTPVLVEAAAKVSKPQTNDQVFDARPGSARRAPAITAEELRAEALRVAHGHGGLKQPATWELKNIPKPTYVEVREATQREIAARVRPEPIPVSEPLRPSKPISLKASEDAKRLAAEVSAEDRAAVVSVSLKSASTETSAPAAPMAPVTPAERILPEPANTPSVTAQQTSEEIGDSLGTATEPALTPAANSKGRLNLDAVMQRRRA